MIFRLSLKERDVKNVWLVMAVAIQEGLTDRIFGAFETEGEAQDLLSTLRKNKSRLFGGDSMSYFCKSVRVFGNWDEFLDSISGATDPDLYTLYNIRERILAIAAAERLDAPSAG